MDEIVRDLKRLRDEIGHSTGTVGDACRILEKLIDCVLRLAEESK